MVPWGTVNFVSRESQCFPRFEGNKIHCSSRDQLLSDLLYSKTKQKQNLKTALRFKLSLATAVNISRVTVNWGAFHLVKNSENSGSGLNGKRFFGSPDWKIPRKSGTAQKVVPFSRLERPNGNLFSIYRISRLCHQFHAFRGLLSCQASLGSLVFPKNGG